MLPNNLRLFESLTNCETSSAGLHAIQELNGVSDIGNSPRSGPRHAHTLGGFSATRGSKQQQKIQTNKSMLGKWLMFNVETLWTVRKIEWGKKSVIFLYAAAWIHTVSVLEIEMHVLCILHQYIWVQMCVWNITTSLTKYLIWSHQNYFDIKFEYLHVPAS